MCSTKNAETSNLTSVTRQTSPSRLADSINQVKGRNQATRGRKVRRRSSQRTSSRRTGNPSKRARTSCRRLRCSGTTNARTGIQSDRLSSFTHRQETNILENGSSCQLSATEQFHQERLQLLENDSVFHRQQKHAVERRERMLRSENEQITAQLIAQESALRDQVAHTGVLDDTVRYLLVRGCF